LEVAARPRAMGRQVHEQTAANVLQSALTPSTCSMGADTAVCALKALAPTVSAASGERWTAHARWDSALKGWKDYAVMCNLDFVQRRGMCEEKKKLVVLSRGDGTTQVFY
jgi:hypothetical protein